MNVTSEPIEVVQLQRPNLKLFFFSGPEGAAAWAIEANDEHPRGVLIAMNAEKLVKLYSDPDLFSGCRWPIYYPDGVGAALLGSGAGSNIPGVELWLHVLDRAVKRMLACSVIGASTDVSERTGTILRARHPEAKLHVQDGFKSEEIYIRHLVEWRPDVVFVALGSPRQELLIARMQEHHPNALYMGLGGSLDILVGTKTRAPRAFRAMKIEFAYRLLKEPTRFFRQTALVRFLLLHLTRSFGARVVSDPATGHAISSYRVRCTEESAGE